MKRCWLTLQNEPTFLDLDDILQIHADTMLYEGGTQGVRDISLVDSAVAAPRASFGGEFLYPDMPAMTGALMFALVSNHGFIDGNKRVGTLAALVFRQVNGLEAFPPSAELELVALSVARGEMGREELTEWWRSH